MDGITDVTEDDQLTLTVLPTGSVLLGTSEGAFRFRTIAAFDACMERVDRERATYGYHAASVDEYQQRLRWLQAQRSVHAVTDHRDTA